MPQSKNMYSCSIFLLFLLLTGRGFSQCFTDSECTGSTVAAGSNRDCCFETADGLAFLSNGTCTACPSELLHIFCVILLLSPYSRLKLCGKLIDHYMMGHLATASVFGRA